MSDKERSTDIAGALARFEMELRLGLALRESRPLRAAILGDAASVTVDLPMDAGYMAISADGLRLSRGRHAETGNGLIHNYSDLIGSAPLQSTRTSSSSAIAPSSRHSLARRSSPRMRVRRGWPR